MRLVGKCVRVADGRSSGRAAGAVYCLYTLDHIQMIRFLNFDWVLLLGWSIGFMRDQRMENFRRARPPKQNKKMKGNRKINIQVSRQATGNVPRAEWKCQP